MCRIFFAFSAIFIIYFQNKCYQFLIVFSLVYSLQTFNLRTFCVYLLRNNRQPILYQRFPKLRLQGANFKFSNFKFLNVWQSERRFISEMLTAIFHAKKQELKQEDKVYRFRTDFSNVWFSWTFGTKNSSNMVGDVMVGGGLNNEYSSKKTQNLINVQKVYEYSSKWT